jgi:four helix bundle protein
MGGYRDMEVWRRARALAVDVIRSTSSGAFKHDWALRDQMRRAAISVPSNIAEGSQRGSNPDSVRFFHFARGSLAELSTQADIAGMTGFIEPLVTQRWLQECDELGGMLCRLIDARKRRR